jgi:hypothetical protein
MVAFSTTRLPVQSRHFSGLVIAVLGALLTPLAPMTVLAQSSLPPANVQPISPTAPASAPLNLTTTKRLISEAESAIASQNYISAAQKLLDARKASNQLSDYYQQLSSSFLGVDTQVYNSLRTKALEAAQARDNATYQLALVYRAQNRPEQAVPLLVEIIRSQQPTRELGGRAYQQLLEIGFIDTPFTAPRPGSRPPAPPANNSPASPQPPAPQPVAPQR